MLLALVLVGSVAACGGADEAACGPVTEEALDPASGVHLLPDAPDPGYATDPPTSGAHYGLPPPSGVVADPLDRPMQVTVLEGGAVLLQYRDDLPPDDLATLESLADDRVVVAPNPDQNEPLVMTAWLTKQTCSGVVEDVVDRFIAEHQGGGPGSDV
jgi:hypothetical protein